MPTFEQVMEWAPLLEWVAAAAIVGALVKVTRKVVITKDLETSRVWATVDKAALFVPLPLCLACGAFLDVPEVLRDHMSPYLFWGSTWVGGLVGRKRLDVGGA